MEAKRIPTLKERYEALNKAEQAALREAVMGAAKISTATFYRYIDEPLSMNARAMVEFCLFFDVLADELLYIHSDEPQPEKQSA